MQNDIKKTKKAIELSLETIVVFIIAIIVLIVIIYFFSGHYNTNQNSLVDIGDHIINQSKKY